MTVDALLFTWAVIHFVAIHGAPLDRLWRIIFTISILLLMR